MRMTNYYSMEPRIISRTRYREILWIGGNGYSMARSRKILWIMGYGYSMVRARDILWIGGYGYTMARARDILEVGVSRACCILGLRPMGFYGYG